MQRYCCKRCNKTFSEEQPLEGVRLEHSKIVQIVKLLTEGVGVRSAARIIGCDTHTILNVLETIGQKIEALHDRLAVNISVESLQIDELWARVGVSQRRTTDLDLERGDQYTFLAVAAKEKFIVSYHTGKRTLDNTDIFIGDVHKRIKGRVQITTDSFHPYKYIVRKHFWKLLDFATMQKIYGADHNIGLGENRRYTPARCKSIRKHVRCGVPKADLINTSYVERANLTVRHFTKRFSRLGLGYSRKLANHRHAISLFVACYNFCKVHSTLGTTPANALKITSEPWSIERLIEEATATI